MWSGMERSLQRPSWNGRVAVMRFDTILRLVLVIPLVGALLAGGEASAQTNSEVNSAIQFDFSIPGTRGLAMGGASLSVAGDAAAAYVNPAALAEVKGSQVLLEGRSWRTSAVFADRGHAFGEPTGIGTDTIAGLVTGETRRTTAGLSFASYAYGRGKWALAVYRHELANKEASFRTQGAYYGTWRLSAARVQYNLRIAGYGLSGSYRLSERLFLGVGVAFYRFQQASDTQLFFNPETYGPPPDYAPDNVLGDLTETGDDGSSAFSLGALWKPTSRLRISGVFRKGPVFTMETKGTTGPRAYPAGEVFSNRSARFHVPDVFGIGLSYEPTERTTLVAEYDRVRYSQMTHGFQNIWGSDNYNEGLIDQYKLDDANQIHVGVEYGFDTKSWRLDLRLGLWHDPDHGLRFESEYPEGYIGGDLDQQTLFRGGEDAVHCTGGIGLAIGQRIRIDAAIDFSDRIDVASLSMIATF